MKYVKKLGILVSILVLIAAPLTTTTFAAPDDGVYDIAVLEVGLYTYWTSGDFGELSVAPGVYSYTWTTIPESDLTDVGLASYDVLIIPWHHNYAWLDASEAMAIVNWVNGGNKLIIHNYEWLESIAPDTLMAYFGADYYAAWTGEYVATTDDDVIITDATDPLVTYPNSLSAAALSYWARTVHNTIDPVTAGPAWHWVIDGVENNNHWLGWANSGSGCIVLCGGDPEYHSPSTTEAAKLIENEIVFEPSVIDQQQTQDFHFAGCFDKYWHGQSFKPGLSTLTGVKLYIMKSGAPPNPAVLSVRSSLTGPPLTSIALPAAAFPISWDWVEFDLPDIPVIPGNTYYLTLHTFGGTIHNSYIWSYGLVTPYTNGELWRSYSYGMWGSWVGCSWYDFCFKTYGY
jgi:hypothetical protein